jgi:hypothetical protein
MAHEQFRADNELRDLKLKLDSERCCGER